MTVPALSPTLRQSLELHGCTLEAQNDTQDDEEVIRMLLHDQEGAYQIGHVIDQRGLWTAYAQLRPRAVFGIAEAGRFQSFEDALLAVLVNFVG